MNRTRKPRRPLPQTAEAIALRALADAWAVKLRAALQRGATVEEMDALYMEMGR